MELTAWMAERTDTHRRLLEAALKHDRPSNRATRPSAEEEPDETLVADHRGSLRPAQHVEHKLVSMLQTSAVFLSHLQKDARPTR